MFRTNLPQCVLESYQVLDASGLSTHEFKHLPLDPFVSMLIVLPDLPAKQAIMRAGPTRIE